MRILLSRKATLLSLAVVACFAVGCNQNPSDKPAPDVGETVLSEDAARSADSAQENATIAADDGSPAALVKRGDIKYRAASAKPQAEANELYEQAWQDFRAAHELAGGAWRYDFTPWKPMDDAKRRLALMQAYMGGAESQGSAKALIGAAKICARLFHVQEAAVLAEKAFAIDPDDAYVRMNHTMMLAIARNEWTGVPEKLKKFTESPDIEDKAAAWFAYARSLTETGDIAGSEKAYRKTLELNPEAEAARSNLVHVLATLGRTEEARELLATLDSANASEIYATLNFGSSLMAQGKFDEALPMLESVVERAPGLPAGWLGLAGCYKELERYEDALRTSKVIKNMMPEQIFGYLLVGDINIKLGENEKAIETLKECIDKFPGVWNPYMGLFQAHDAMGNRPMAEEALKHAWKMECQNSELVYAYYEYLQRQNQNEELVRVMTGAIKRKPKTGLLYSYRAIGYVELGELEKALADRTRAVELDPTSDNYIARAHVRRLLSLPAADILEDLEGALNVYQGHAYASALLWITANEDNQSERASRAVKTAAAKALPDNWYGHIVRYLAGELSQDEFIAFADDDGKRCECFYFVAEKTLRGDGAEAAKPWFEKCTALGQERYWEHKLSKKRLAEME